LTGTNFSGIPNSALGTNLAAIGNLANAAGALTNNGSGTFSYQASLTNPMTTLGDTIYGGASGAVTRLAGLSVNGLYVLTANPTASAAVAPAWSAAATGSGAPVFATSPTLTTPTLGAATATTINKVTITAPATAATLTLVTGSTLQTTGAFTLNLTTTAATTPTFPAGTGTLVYLGGTNTWSAAQTFSVSATFTAGFTSNGNVSITTGYSLACDTLTNYGTTLKVNAAGSQSLALQLNATSVMSWAAGGNTAVHPGSIDISTAGSGLKVAEGSNAKQGTATLVSGTVTVSNTSVTATSRIFLTRQGINSSTAMGELAVSARTAGTSFTITSYTAGAVTTQTGDLSTVAWEIFEVG
jgi:hypothetical protein